MKDKKQLNNGEWVTQEEYDQLRSAIDQITRKLKIAKKNKYDIFNWS